MQYAAATLLSDRAFVMAALQLSGFALKWAAAPLRGDRQLALAAVAKSGVALQYTSDAIKNDRQVVLAACQQNGQALVYASAGLRGDREVALAAVSNKGTLVLEHILPGSAACMDEEVLRVAHEGTAAASEGERHTALGYPAPGKETCPVASHFLDLNAFTQHCFQRCTTPAQLDRMVEDLHPIISEAVARGDAATRNWADTRCPDVLMAAAELRATTKDGTEGDSVRPSKKARMCVDYTRRPGN